MPIEALYKRIDEILYYKWDPIGISDTDWARDEYQSYLPTVYRMVIQDSAPEAIANYLDGIAVSSMGLNSAKEHCYEMAELMLSVKDLCLEDE